MCPTTPVPLDTPAILWVVARRELNWPHRPMYYSGPIGGFDLDINQACVWPARKMALDVASVFSFAVVVRVLVWHPLPMLVHPDDAL